MQVQVGHTLGVSGLHSAGEAILSDRRSEVCRRLVEWRRRWWLRGGGGTAYASAEKGSDLASAKSIVTAAAAAEEPGLPDPDPDPGGAKLELACSTPSSYRSAVTIQSEDSWLMLLLLLLSSGGGVSQLRRTSTSICGEQYTIIWGERYFIN